MAFGRTLAAVLPSGPWIIDIDVYTTATSNTGWDTIGGTDADRLHAHTKDSSGAQNDEIAWDVVMDAGTWTFELVHRKSSNLGIYTVSIDGVSAGTIDGYAASATVNQRGIITGIVVASQGKHTLKLKMATKNASSSNYFGGIDAVRLKRTA